MPEKEGAEEKTTKEVVNKKQKQMMNKEEYTTEMVRKIKKKISARAVYPTVAQNKVRGEIVKGDDLKIDSKNPIKKKMQKNNLDEEGYDIARDMGRVRPSKDKKDATTMPVSDEVKKTQKVVKGPSAFERVKAKYGKSVMNVGKKKVKEELDLTQVAEALGGYIVEGKVEDEKKKADAQFKKDFAKSLERGTVTQKALPLYKAGGPFVPDKTVDAKTGKKVEPMEKKPYMGKATVPDTSKKEPIPADTGAGDPKEVKKTKKKFSDFSKKIQSLKKDQGKAKQDVVDVDSDKFY